MTLTITELILMSIIAAIAGAIGQSLVGYRFGGFLVSAFVGFIGAIIGVWLARELDLPKLLVVSISNKSFPLIWSIIGSAIFSIGLGLFTRRRSRLF